jgi:hypothetical protein
VQIAVQLFQIRRASGGAKPCGGHESSVAHRPKFSTRASPHTCTISPLSG